MPPFADLVREYLDEAFRLDPLFATAAGVHDHDGSWPDLSESGRAAALAAVETWHARLAACPDGVLSFDERIDRDRLLAHLAARRHALVDARDEAWDPLWWVYVFGDGLFGLLAREFAPPSARLASVADRLERLPAVVDAACHLLGSVSARPVSAYHAERALLDLPGIPSLIDEAVALGGGLEPGPGVDALRARLGVAAAIGRGAIDRYEGHLREVVLPAATGDGILGRERYVAKLGFTLGDPSLAIDHILGEADRIYDGVRREMARLAAALWPEVAPGQPAPDDPDRLVRATLDRIGLDHSTADELIDVSRDALARIEAFCRESDLIGLADEPLEIAWTPVFLRGWAQAMLSSPGPFEPGQKALFHITPVPASWSPELRESYLREMNRRQLEVLTIHEAVPGHYLQGVYANRAASLVRAVFGDGTYQEGWAVYVTQVLFDAGYRRDDRALRLAHWKYFLRAVANTIIDIRIHTAGMTEAEALAVMIDGTFQEEAEARAKYRRARLTSTQLSMYFVGGLGFWELEHEVRGRAAIAAGDPRGVDVIPRPAVVGGYPATPGFAYRPWLEGLISHGPLPLPLLRRVVLDGPTAA